MTCAVLTIAPLVFHESKGRRAVRGGRIRHFRRVGSGRGGGEVPQELLRRDLQHLRYYYCSDRLCARAIIQVSTRSGYSISCIHAGVNGVVSALDGA